MFKNIINYALNKNLITKRDVPYVINALAGLLSITNPLVSNTDNPKVQDNIDSILAPLLIQAEKQGLLKSLHPDFSDLLDTQIMGIFCNTPSIVQNIFEQFSDTQKATDWFYQYNIDINYIRMQRILKNIQWNYDSPYGALEITINLSKPEKDPLAIIAQTQQIQHDYPLCVLCKENEGYVGNISQPARQNLRLIEIQLNQESWYFQYSPYIYYPHHSILLSSEHRPMVINKKTFQNLLLFLDQFPHYFIGSNADLPIVGGSILSHDHYQAGRYTFPLNYALPLKQYSLNTIECSLLKWPLNIILLSSSNKYTLIDYAHSLLEFWKSYNNPSLGIFSHTDHTPHNTITPIARKNKDKYELYLTLRNNYTTTEHPLGVFHPHAEYHHIKKENIGLIEVLGLAILPGRLKKEIQFMEQYLLQNIEISEINTHKEWLDHLKTKYQFTKQNIDQILQQEIGLVYSQVLENCGVFKNTEEFDNFTNCWLSST
ncbi:MAG: UDP-glucose--hexose-1-phosphate uridylyltransferase [Brevinema sp.]